jgi:hypothetical protein
MAQTSSAGKSGVKRVSQGVHSIHADVKELDMRPEQPRNRQRSFEGNVSLPPVGTSMVLIIGRSVRLNPCQLKDVTAQQMVDVARLFPTLSPNAVRARHISMFSTAWTVHVDLDQCFLCVFLSPFRSRAAHVVQFGPIWMH